MGFVRVNEQKAARANGILDSAIAKLKELLSSQGNTINDLSGNADVLSSSINPKLSEIGGQISSLIGQITSLKGQISSKAKELDDIAEREWIAKQKALEKAKNANTVTSQNSA